MSSTGVTADRRNYIFLVADIVVTYLYPSGNIKQKSKIIMIWKMQLESNVYL